MPESTVSGGSATGVSMRTEPFTDTASKVRRLFADHFGKRGHVQVPGASLIPAHDPSLMFTNSGMVQFKDNFTARIPPISPRVFTIQPCVRAGGKHNDLENVGYTKRHHTFFEMLGNFSFGDYFRAQAIDHAWTFLTETLGLPKDRLYVTYHAQDPQTRDSWAERDPQWASLEGRLIAIDGPDNFWSMGPVGPCGYCTEIFYDHGSSVAGGPPGSIDADGDRYVEIWNLVFMQFEQHADGTRTPLASQSVDTGMGLERLCAVIEGTPDNFATSLFRPLIEVSIGLLDPIARTKHLQPKTLESKEGDLAIINRQTSHEEKAHRVIADHIRAIGFLMADGVVPQNEGAGYVLRRIMRRAMRYAHTIGASQHHLSMMLPELVKLMGAAYPALIRHQEATLTWVYAEEERFFEALKLGIERLRVTIEEMIKTSSNLLSGAVAFELYDTHGFPIDLIEDELKPHGYSIDRAAFDQAMEAQRQRARNSRANATSATYKSLAVDLAALPATIYVSHLGDMKAKILSLETIDQNNGPPLIRVVLDQTNFYAESGGAAGDKGLMVGPHGRVQITDTQKHHGRWVHTGQMLDGHLGEHDVLDLTLDVVHRRGVMAHHTATHLMAAALRSIQSTPALQKGSQVTHDTLRFDITQPGPIHPSTLREIQDKVNDAVGACLDVGIKHDAFDRAVASGAVSIAGEVYPDWVRIVRIVKDGMIESIELCGGEHTRHTGEIGGFALVAERSVASGVRRLEAVCGPQVAKLWSDLRGQVGLWEQLAQAAPGQMEAALRKSAQENQRLMLRQTYWERQGVLDHIHTHMSTLDAGLGEPLKVAVGLWPHDVDVDMKKACPLALEVADVAIMGQIGPKGIGLSLALGPKAQQLGRADVLARHIGQSLGATKGGGQGNFAQIQVQTIETSPPTAQGDMMVGVRQQILGALAGFLKPKLP